MKQSESGWQYEMRRWAARCAAVCGLVVGAQMGMAAAAHALLDAQILMLPLLVGLGAPYMVNLCLMEMRGGLAVVRREIVMMASWTLRGLLQFGGGIAIGFAIVMAIIR